MTVFRAHARCIGEREREKAQAIKRNVRRTNRRSGENIRGHKGVDAVENEVKMVEIENAKKKGKRKSAAGG